MKEERTTVKLSQFIKENMSFLAVLLALFLSLALIVGLTFGSFYKSLRANSISTGNMIVAYEARRLEEALYSSVNTLLVSSYTVDSMLRHNASPQEVEDYLVLETSGIISGIDPDFSGLYGVIDGIYVDGVGWKPEDGYDPYARPWYIAAAEEQGELAAVSPYIDAQTKNIMISFSKLLCDGKSAISLDIRLNHIYEVTKSVQLNGSGYCLLIDGKGQVIAHYDDTRIGENYLSDPEFENTDIRTLTRQIVESSGSQTFQDVLVDGERCIVFTDKVQGDWSIALVVRSADLFKDLRVSLLHSILVSLVVFLLIGYFCTSNYWNKKRALRYAADIRIDNLTGLNNRGEFDRYLSTAINNIPPSKKLYLLIFDADDFKSINDRFGHQEGDRALRLIAKAFMSVCNNTDWFCARYGGDEFVIVCKSNDEQGVRKIETDINECLSSLVAENELSYSVSLSCGYACYSLSMQSLSDFVVAADKDLYQRKAEKKV